MKHTLGVTFALIAVFIIAQAFGLFTVAKYVNVTQNEDGSVEVGHPETFLGEQPDLSDSQKNYSFIMLMVAILGGTLVLLFLIKVHLGVLWKYWFFLAVFFAMSVSVGVYLPIAYALIFAAVFGFIKAFKPNVIIHNFTEPLIYTGITLLILPWLNVLSGFVLLLLISMYDLYAVWKSEHMVKLANFQTEQRAFAGLYIPYSLKKSKDEKIKKVNKSKGKARKVVVKKKVKEAILGGGDIAFPLLFAAAVLERLISLGYDKLVAFGYSFIISFGAASALFLLFYFAKKDKFYPAMPFISAGCLVGYAIVYFIVMV